LGGDRPRAALAQLEWHRRILDVRHKEIVPRLPTIRAGGTYRILGDGGACGLA